MEPKVSVVIPTYNRPEEVRQAVRSVLDQTYQDFEIIVVDDGSNGPTYIEGVNKNIYQSHTGAAVARNRGIDEARGNYIAFLDSDDAFLPRKLEKQVAIMETNPKVILSHTSYARSNDNSLEMKEVNSGAFTGKVYPRIYLRCPIAMSTVMVQAEYLKRQEYHFQEGIHGNDDLILWAKLARLAPIIGIPEPLSIISVGDNTSAFNFKLRAEAARNLIKYGLEKDKHLPLPFLYQTYWSVLGLGFKIGGLVHG